MARHRPFEDAEDGAVERGVDDTSVARAAHVALIERGDRGLRGENTPVR